MITAKNVSLAILTTLTLTLAGATTAYAHVTVTPSEVAPVTYQTFTVNVPNEKDIPTVTIKVMIPDGVTRATPTNKPGWKITTEAKTNSQNDDLESIIWSGNEITKGFRDEFTFNAKTPDKMSEIKWKAYQTYSDGSIVAWDQDSSNEGHTAKSATSGPLSVTSVTEHTPADDNLASNDRTLSISLVALGIAFISIFLSTRKNK